MKYELLPSLFALPSTDALPAASKGTVRARTKTRHLGRREVVRLERAQQFKKIEVKRGVVWLTGTPADADVILQSGQTFEFRDSWPYVIEAVEMAEISLT